MICLVLGRLESVYLAKDPKASVNNREPNFTEEQFALFERFENKYGLYVDQDYIVWLQLYHPSSLPEELSSAEGATSNVKSSGLEGEMELSVLSTNHPSKVHQFEIKANLQYNGLGRYLL